MEKNSWRKISELRETVADISGWEYSIDYVRENNLSETWCSHSCLDIHEVWVPEVMEVAIDDDSEIVYRVLSEKEWFDKNKKEKFETSAGTFIFEDNIIAVGKLITPKGRIKGNFVEVFECGGRIYAIDTSKTVCWPCMNIYTFDENLSGKEIYSSQKDSCENLSKMLSFRGLFLNEDVAYILASGTLVNDDFSIRDIKKTYLFMVKDGSVSVKAEFDICMSYVKNIIVRGNELIVGMDKVVLIADLLTKEIKKYTQISEEAEEDIIKSKSWF